MTGWASAPPLLAILATALLPGIVAGQGIAPAPPPLGIETFALSRDGRVSKTIVVPAGDVSIVLDVRRADAKEGPIHSHLTVRDSGDRRTPLAELRVDDIEIESRGVSHLVLSQSSTLVVEVSNAADAATYWLAVVPATSAARGLVLPVALFGSTHPLSLVADTAVQGRLDKGEHAYFIARLAAGSYTSTLELLNPTRSVTNIRGLLTLLDQDGHPVQRLVDIDAVDWAYTDAATFSVGGGVYVFKIYNAGGSFPEYYRLDFSLSVRRSER